ncbi:diguanylate cyclase/phosphodiesterase with PAS/PAC sensor(s) [Aquipluma nitroreducens]|uniref:histidine kinase n=1 Tax=Aquipluma nitroreducens TaxID=2010828 RepID=A0A5K7S3P6_9BACT|nr:PAS domain S-box protein [Aquipluma nitroreducens]BBE16119.1 diguanylate cyclase/phosphodiesterase with PAS/PAC sensor(s) [Aquipluma nitroreducens]
MTKNQFKSAQGGQFDRILQLRTLIDNIPDPIYVKDTVGRKTVANIADVLNIGRSNESDVLGKTDLELFEGEIGERGFSDDSTIFQTGEAIINREEKFIDKNGHEHWLLTSKIPIFNDQGGMTGLVGIGREITEIKNAGNQIRKLSKSIEQSPSTIIITDTQGQIEYVNPKFIEITGYDAEEVIGKKPSILKSGQMSLEFYQQLWNTISSGEVWRGEFLNRKKNGELYWEWATMTSIKDETGTITNYIAIKEDISLRKKIEADLIIAKNKAEESDRLKSAFLANMSHEVRTPLNSIIGFSELLADPDFEEDNKREFIQHIISNGNNLLTIISDIMDISKLEAGELKIYSKPVNVYDFISNIKNQITYQSGIKGLDFEANIPDARDISIFVDPDRLRQIINNLISNAIKFTAKGGIEIGYQLSGEMVEFYVKDTGIGIPLEYHDKIFERFRQVEDERTRKYGGNGLGLAITKNLVELMGENIWLKTKEGQETIFYFTIPKHTN